MASPAAGGAAVGGAGWWLCGVALWGGSVGWLCVVALWGGSVWWCRGPGCPASRMSGRTRLPEVREGSAFRI